MAIFKRVLIYVSAAIALLAVMQCAEAPENVDAPQPAQTVESEGLMTAAVEVDGWQLDDEPLVYVGDSLYEMINGGAELYHQFGFVQALAAQYADPDGREIALEVFEMGDVEGARNIYTDKTGGAGEPLDIGDEAAGESYYMNFRRDRFLVTITGFDSEPETTEGILRLARAVAPELGGDQ